MLCESKDCRIDEPQPQALVSAVQFEDSGVVLRKEIGDEERAVDKALVEGGLRLSAETFGEQIIDLRKNRGGNDEPTHFPFDQGTGGWVPGITAIVVSVEDPGVQQDGHLCRCPLPRREAKLTEKLFCPFSGLGVAAVEGASPRGSLARKTRKVGLQGLTQNVRHGTLAAHGFQLEQNLEIWIKVDGRSLHNRMLA
jgi:hypothetical protein